VFVQRLPVGIMGVIVRAMATQGLGVDGDFVGSRGQIEAVRVCVDLGADRVQGLFQLLDGYRPLVERRLVIEPGARAGDDLVEAVSAEQITLGASQQPRQLSAQRDAVGQRGGIRSSNAIGSRLCTVRTSSSACSEKNSAEVPGSRSRIAEMIPVTVIDSLRSLITDGSGGSSESEIEEGGE
jgi:hypothetical protein